MNNNLTEIVIILDRSGSMQNLTGDTIGGFNSFVEGQKKEEGEARLTAVLFDDKYEILHNGINIRNVPALTEKEYYARGMTAMLDAIGKTINDIGERLSKTDENDRPGKVIFVITTDGMENASREFSKKQIKEIIERQQNIYNWTFLFLGANIDSFSEAGSIGIAAPMVANYDADSGGSQLMYASVSRAVMSSRRNQRMGIDAIDDDWADDLKQDKKDKTDKKDKKKK